MYSCLWKSISKLRSVTCHMGSHSVTCHPTQVSTPRLNPSHTGWYSIYLPRRDSRLSWPRWLIMWWPGVEPATLGSRVQHANHYTTKPAQLQICQWQVVTSSNFECKEINRHRNSTLRHWSQILPWLFDITCGQNPTLHAACPNSQTNV